VIPGLQAVGTHRALHWSIEVAAEDAMRNVKVLKNPVGVIAAWILALGYVLWAVEAVGAKTLSKPVACEAPRIQVSAPLQTGSNS